MPSRFSIGVDFGTNSVRALAVDVQTGEEVGTCVFEYPSGDHGILLDRREPDVARQHPQDYLDGLEASIRGALEEASRRDGFDSSNVIGIGIDTTGSTPIPVDAAGVPLAFDPRFTANLNAHVWLWKDHTAHAEAAAITALARSRRPEYLTKCGGTYSSEWFWSKILHCLRVDSDVFDAAYTWVEHADWMPAVLTGTEHPNKLRRGVCAAGHKAMFNAAWGGYPDEEFLGALDARLAALRRTLPDTAYNAAEAA
ncbi:MAG: FGGY family carbohydrate kinase, partial [Rhodothermales bacterium]